MPMVVVDNGSFVIVKDAAYLPIAIEVDDANDVDNDDKMDCVVNEDCPSTVVGVMNAACVDATPMDNVDDVDDALLVSLGVASVVVEVNGGIVDIIIVVAGVDVDMVDDVVVDDDVDADVFAAMDTAVDVVVDVVGDIAADVAVVDVATADVDDVLNIVWCSEA
mmetsp:Transcript_28712/g.60381  ORF Transcript_28712/g.60381 Transcript_28712/m.60381 type:complete len:164 (+) Transcript_28712:460-951(+)